MAKGIKGITIELNGDTTNLSKALSDVNKETYSLETELKQIESALKFNPGNMGLLAQKSQVLNEEISALNKKFETLKDAKKQVDEQFAKGELGEEQYRAFNRELIKTESKLLEMNGRLDENEKAVKSNGQAVEETTKSYEGLSNVAGAVATTLGASLAALGVAAVGATTALISLSKSGAEYADGILTMSTVTGMSTESLQAYNYAAELVDVSMDTLTGSMAKNIKSMSTAAEGTGDIAEAYQRLRVSVTDSEDNLKDSEKVYWETIDALKGISDETERDALAMKIFGKSAQDLNPLILQGSEGIAELTEQAKEMGAVLGDEALNSFGQFDDNIQKLKSGWTSLANVGGTLLLPMLNDISGEGVNLLGNFTKALNEAGGDPDKIQAAITEGLNGILDVIMEFLPEMMEMGINLVRAIILGIVEALPQITDAALSVLNLLVEALVDLLPIILDAGFKIVVALALGIAEALPELIPTIVELLLNMVQIIIENLPLLIDAAFAIMDGLAKGLIDALPLIIDMLPEIIKSIVNFMASASPQFMEQGIFILFALLQGILEAIPDLVLAIPEIVAAILEGFIAQGEAYMDVGKNIMEGIWEGISSMGDWISEQIGGLFDGIVDGVKDLLGIHSPSTVFASIGEYMAQGLGVGFEDEMSKVQKEIDNAIPTSVDVGVNGSGGTSANSGVSVQYVFNSPKALSESEIRSEIERETQYLQVLLASA